MKYTVIDLKTIAAELEGHFRKSDLPTYTGQCTNCWAEVTQEMNECPSCQCPIVWENSKVWRDLYGPPSLRLTELEQVEPTTYSGRELCAQCNVGGFANQREADDWAKAERNFGQAELSSIIQYVTKDKRGRAAMAHALATVRKKLRERAPTNKQQPTVPSSTKMV